MLTAARLRQKPAVPWFALSLALACGMLAWASVADDRWHALLDYRRADLADGQAWRLLTAHLMHLSGGHAGLDIAGLLLVAWIFGDALAPRHQALVCLVGAAAIDAGLWLLHPEVERYVGLSGLLHAWFAAGAMRWAFARPEEATDRDVFRLKRTWGVVLLAGLVAKLFLEATHQAFWLDGTAFPVVTAAHRWGAAAGCLYGAGLAGFSRRVATGRAGAASRDR